MRISYDPALAVLRAASCAVNIQRMKQLAGAARKYPHLHALADLWPDEEIRQRIPARHTAWLSAEPDTLTEWHAVVNKLCATHRSTYKDTQPHNLIIQAAAPHTYVDGWRDPDTGTFTRLWMHEDDYITTPVRWDGFVDTVLTLGGNVLGYDMRSLAAVRAIFDDKKVDIIR